MLAKVLVADDETEIVELIRDYLEADGFQVIPAQDGEEALHLAQREKVDCLVLDVMMPRRNGFEVCRILRQTSDAPILFLSARQSDTDKIRGLGLGGDDYIGKPFSPAEVVARVKALLRRFRRSDEPSTPELLSFGSLEIDPRGYRVWLNGSEVPMATKEFELLRFLAEHPGQVFTRDQLFDRIWGDFGDLHTVTVHVARIREKIEPDPANPRFIRTVWGVGYRFDKEEV